MRYNTGLTAAPASPFNGSPVCKRSPIQVLTVLNVAAGMQCVMIPDPEMWKTPQYMTEANLVLHSLNDFKPEMFGLTKFSD
jgi:hypothetical protein